MYRLTGLSFEVYTQDWRVWKSQNAVNVYFSSNDISTYNPF